MSIIVEVIDWSDLNRYVSIAACVDVTSVFDAEPVDGGLGGLRLVERAVIPWVKDYDAVNPPAAWRASIPDMRWRLLLASDGDDLVGAAAAYVDGSPIATLWDIRVRVDAQRSGFGRLLVDACSDWAASMGATWLRAETQNVNVPACRFYRALGAHLGGIDTTLYRGSPVESETALFWMLPTSRPA